MNILSTFYRPVLSSILVFFLFTANFGCSKIEEVATQCLEGIYELADGLQVEIRDGNFAVVIGIGDSKLKLQKGDIFMTGLIQTGQNEYQGFVRSDNGNGGLVWGEVQLLDNQATIIPSTSTPYTMVQIETSVPTNDNDANRTWSDWKFIASDKALQYRFSRVSGSGEGIYQIKVQYRINKTDQIFCNDANCLGYIYWGGFYDLSSRNYSKEYRLYFPNDFVGNTPGMPGVYTLSETVAIEIKTYSDGKRIWDEDLQLPFYILNQGNYKQQFRFAEGCVDEKMSNTNANRCSFYNSGPSETIK